VLEIAYTKYEGHGYKTDTKMRDMDTKWIQKRWSVSLAQFLVWCLKWVKYDIVFNAFQRRKFSIRHNVGCV